jgi:hypothetical protein
MEHQLWLLRPRFSCRPPDRPQATTPFRCQLCGSDRGRPAMLDDCIALPYRTPSQHGRCGRACNGSPAPRRCLSMKGTAVAPLIDPCRSKPLPLAGRPPRDDALGRRSPSSRRPLPPSARNPARSILQPSLPVLGAAKAMGDLGRRLALPFSLPTTSSPRRRTLFSCPRLLRPSAAMFEQVTGLVVVACEWRRRHW